MQIVCALLFIVFSFAPSIVIADGPPLARPSEKEFFEKCLTKTGITQQQLKDSSDAINSSPDAPETKDAYCFTKCLVEETGLLNSNKEVDVNKVKDLVTSTLPEPKVDELLKCLEKTGKILTCEDAKKFYKCKPMPKN